MRKSTLLTFLFVFFTTIFFESCSKNSKPAEAVNNTPLREDKNFIAAVIDKYQFLISLKEIITQKGLSFTKVQNELNLLSAKKNYNETEQLKEIEKILGSDFAVKAKNHMNSFAGNWRIVQMKYKNISNDLLEKECQAVLKNKYAPNVSNKGNSTNLPIASRQECCCGWRYYLCAGAATAGAIICHGGCDATALATTAGLGIPACITACGTLQAYAIVQCADSYCN
jgi:hypothetical protein